ncbi:allatostatin-A receptor-like [Denticeps clupeoides]|uniref:allatostatin-A receptor-like n=1 Tax=Denticeps clupeoides TaxID=299321 RepID=UPI0010A4E0EC|nr:allatostatin-A receptor-like [Denticeps clupeoides]
MDGYNFSVSTLSNMTITMQGMATTTVGINFLLSFPLNSYVMWLIVSGTGSGVASEIFSLNLAVCEMFFCVGSVLLRSFCFMPSDLLGKVACFVLGAVACARPMFQCCICLEHHLAVLHPIIFLRSRPLRYRLMCSAVIWLVIFSISLICATLVGFMIMFILAMMSLPLCAVKMFCCLAILRALKKPGPGAGPKRSSSNQAKMKAFKIVLVILVYELVTYSPVFILVVLSSGNRLTSTEVIIGIAIVFSIMMATSFTQPLLHLHRVGKLPCFRLNTG